MKDKIKFDCPFCSRKGLKSRSGLVGHIQLSHPEQYQEYLASPASPPGEDTPPGSEAAGGSKPATGHPAASSRRSVKVLEDEVRSLKLEEELATLRARRADRARLPDVSEMAGLGCLQPDIARQVQARAFEANPPPQQKKDWLEILSSPALPTIVAALKGILGTGDGGTAGLGILRELGIDLKSLWERSQAPKADSSVKVGGISLEGAHLTPELWQSIIAYEQAKEDMSYRKEKDKVLAGGLESLTRVISESGVLGKFVGGGDNNGHGISTRADGGGETEQIIKCERCGTINQVPADIQPGQQVKCQGMVDGEPCPESWTAQDSSKPQPKQPKRKVAKVVKEPELPKEIPCESCGQLISIADKPLGSELVCPVCHETQILMSLEIPLAPAEPPPQESD